MAFDDRLRTAAYTSPSGQRIEFQFDAIERSGSKKAAVHELVQQDKADVQDLGNTAEKIPFSCYFTGAEADRQGEALWTALAEKGPGILQHPRYGDLAVLPLSWSSKENLTGSLGRVDFNIDFIRVPDEVPFPQTSVAITEAVEIQTSEAMEIQTEEFASVFDPENAADLSACKESALSESAIWLDTAAAVVAEDEDLATRFDKAVREFTNEIDELLAEPAEFVQKYTEILRMPAQAVGKITTKINAYAGQIREAVLSVPKSYAQAAVYVSELLGLTAGAAEATTSGSIASRQEAVLLADTLQEIADTANGGIESAEGSTEFRPPVEAMALLSDAVSSARDSLLSRAFSLRSERTKVLEAARTPLDLVAELYGGEIDALDEFIETNGLEGDEILIIPAGREVLFYE